MVILLKNVFRKKKHIKLGLYGPSNSGKTTLANRICKDWLGQEIGIISTVSEEKREVQIKEQINVKSNNNEISFNLVDAPELSAITDYEDLMKTGLGKEEAKTRAKEATKSVIDAIRWLEEMDAVIVVLDATKDPYIQVNITIVGNLSARNIPVIIAANKIDLKNAETKKFEDAFPQYAVVGISAKSGKNIENFYKALLKLIG